jgi:hypothetical protein
MQGEILRNGVTYIWSVFGAIITVTAPDGRQKKTQVGGHRGNPQGLARIMACELGNEQSKSLVAALICSGGALLPSASE